MKRVIAPAVALAAVGVVAVGCSGEEKRGGSETRTGSSEVRTFGEFLDDFNAGNVQRVVITANCNVTVKRRNRERYELGQFVGVRARRELSDVVPALRLNGVKVDVAGAPEVCGVRPHRIRWYRDAPITGTPPR